MEIQPGKIKRQKKISEYGRQLREKQDLKKIYGVAEGQMRRYIELARKMPGNSSENLLILLERRADNIIFRLGFAKTRPQARQYITHGLFLLNGRKIDIPSVLLKEGDTIEPKKKERYKEEDLKISVSWLVLDKKNKTGQVKKIPAREDIDTPVNESLVMQFYAR